jgi:prepilin-type N-terminal cleavage/methylation domain-containing protein
MKLPGKKGLTMVELLVSFTIMGIIAVVATPLFSTCLDTYRIAYGRSMLYQEGLLAMERMTGGVRRSACLLIPNNHNTTRDILAFSGFVNDDNDYYFGDPLFPRIDEDPGNDMNNDGYSGIFNIDDDGNGTIDEEPDNGDDGGDDDEDGRANEDRLDGIDNDGDGNIDEDLQHDTNRDNAPGIAGMDDDGDGDVDENVAGGPKWADDDEDGLIDEDPLNPLIYSFDSGTNTLRERFPYTGESVDLSTHVTSFQVTYIYDAPAPESIIILIKIELTLTDDGETVMFSEYVYPRNTLQKTGKRVR